jgi:hypothetical protein
MVANLDGDEAVYDAYLFTGVKLMSIEHSGFDYRQTAPSSGITTAAGDGSVIQPQTIIVQNERTPIQLKKLTFAPQHTQYYCQFTGNAITLEQLLGDI